ncbi:lipoyl domain-containing protein [Thermaurantiacus sp.]
MPVPVTIPPELWAEDDPTGATLLWLREDGAAVGAGDPIAELLVEKVTLELEAPASGRLRIRTAPDAVVHRGDLVALID